MPCWNNWSGSVSSTPREWLAPRSEEELCTAVRRAEQVRVVGAGHSFTPLCATSGTLIDLRQVPAALRIDGSVPSAWAPAGWSLARLTRALWEHGYALPNQGDINPQSLAGAIATGTHGTGADLGSLSTIARAFRLLLADGSIVECSRSERPELFEAQRLSLGLLGVALAVCIDIVPAYRLEERTRAVPIREISASFDEIAAQHRHAEFWLFPYADHVILKTLHPTEDPAPFKAAPAYEEHVFKLCCDLSAAFPSKMSYLQRGLMRLVASARRVGPAHQIFPTERNVRFEEMEYELPRAAGLTALLEAVDRVRAKRLPVTFPFEFRWTAGDDIWLSPFNRGPAASVSVHQYVKLPWREVFAEIEPILRAHGGRPHWAKRHTLTAADVFELYPEAERFCRVRREYDENAKFANPPLMTLFDITRPAKTGAL